MSFSSHSPQSASTSPNPLIVQSDGTMLVEAGHPDYPLLREMLLTFAELLKSPEGFHTYRLSRLSLWNAASTGQTPADVLGVLHRYSRYPLPLDLQQLVLAEMNKYGSLVLTSGGGCHVLQGDRDMLDAIRQLDGLKEHLHGRKRTVLECKPASRGAVKRLLAAHGYPVLDRVGYIDGQPLPVSLQNKTRSGAAFLLRPYQQAAVDAFLSDGPDGGSGVVVLPCGAGKTVVGIAAISAVSAHTLVLTPNVVAARQWMRELLDKTDLDPAWVGEYSADKKEIKPITVTTYQMLTYRRGEEHPHFARLNGEKWGLIVYDEVHLLPAPIFRLTADVQSTRRLGLTATLVREDGAESDVFSLIGPKKYEVPWKEMEQGGYIAPTTCYEVAVGLPHDLRVRYTKALPKQKYRLASTNPRKYDVIASLLEKHRGDRILIIGQYLEQLDEVGERFCAPVLTGKTPMPERERLYDQFRRGELSVLIVSKVANVAIDLPDANVAIQISGSFGSRQEEAQRIGRLLRPKPDGGGSHFYTVVSKDTVDWEMATHRQLFLTEQGYTYHVLDMEG
ncbi:helicase-associated domain-containing protein [Tumebacillus sp. DT12]|uniref:DNA 3'-5' helicase n=1 Tax=Tumebacillus lacus TaxID=2995335 RepID=A0ABT3WVM5_9BACL|nr:DNA repair helicase XPB [Tumebacillus lacus]MCX7568651.1 helicase-associated domain-containing protein [Tumebacillus lacus]